MINTLINEIDKYKFIFIEEYFKSDIYDSIKNLLPLLNKYDMNILHKLTLYLIEDISIKYNFPKQNGYQQWLKNNSRDISSLVLTLIPYIGDNNFDKLVNLTDIIFNTNNKNETFISNNILNQDRKDILKKYFPFSNFTLGLLNDKDDILLDLYKNNQHIIYHCIEHNFVAMLETIKITNGKLYVNWINVIPMTNYKKSKLYAVTMNDINKITPLLTPDLNILDYYALWNTFRGSNGLYLGDYYNVLTNGYYNSIKKIKWTIFCQKVKGEYFYMIQYLTKMINIGVIINNTDYYSLTTDDKNRFDKSIKNCIDNLSNNIPVYLDVNWECNILLNIIIFMCLNYSNRYLINDSIITTLDDIINAPDNIELDTGQINTEKTSNDIIINCFNKLEYYDIFTYIKETLNAFKLTPYSKYLLKIKENTLKINMNFFNIIETEDKKMNLKNLYNIAKNLCNMNVLDPVTNEYEYLFLGDIFKKLNEDNAAVFILYYFNPEVRWLNIKRNIEIQEQSTDINVYRETMILLQNAWNSIKYDLPWEYLYDNGLLSEFNINFDLTDNNLLSNDTNIKNQMIKSNLKIFFNNNPQLFTANYFLTNKPYNELTKYDNKTYIDKLTSEIVFYTFYANDWISQINYFNHYINHSVLYVTGSTGTGKSTQVPKLTMYALKMYDYKNDGRIVCTQPRIPPTVGNAKRIAKEMGVDIFEKKFNSNIEYKNDSFYIQYKHANDNHLKKYNDHLTLTIMTDGSLLESLITNPVMKTQHFEISKNDYNYSLDNIYDVVIVDEAHEHNTNMDLILTLMRTTCMINNSIRLIIVSATMDDDEPIYRNYYKFVNDNIVHPIKQPLVLHPLLGSSPDDTQEYLVDSYYLDRRVHISIPKEPFPYKIHEYYDEDIEKLFSKDMKKNAELAQKKSYTTILNICNKSDIGDILLFSIGEEDIKQAVDELNRITPQHIIALPFYSRMNNRYKEIIEDIDKNISKIRNKKNNIAIEWNENWKEVNDVPTGSYKRAIIVATNVAEASITIDTLRYVVDTGYAKNNIYSIDSDSYEIVLEQISESSRIQRKGRVGRVAEGHVYHMYGKGKRENVKIKYKITSDFIYMGFIKLLYVDNTNVIFDNIINPYLYEYFYNNIAKNIRNEEYLDKKRTLQRMVFIILNQFLSCGQPPNINYFYPFNELTGEAYPNYLNRYDKGYPYYDLLDLTGKLYIIHPLEYRIRRNILGNIIYFDKILIDNIKIENYKSFEFTIINKLFLVPRNNKQNELLLVKTHFFDKINEVITLTKLTDKNAVILFLLSGYNMLYEGCEIISMVNTLNGNMSSLIMSNNNLLSYKEILNIFGSDSDVTSIYNICKTLREQLKELIIFNIFNNKTIFNKYKNQFDLILNNFKNNNLYDIKESLNIMNSLKNNGRLDNNLGYLYWLKSSNTFKKIISDDLLKNKDKIIKICNSNYLNYNTIMNYFNNLITLTLTVYTANIEYEQRYKKINPFEWSKILYPSLLKPITKNTPEEKINLVFFISQPLYFSVMFENGYKNMYHLDCSIKPLFKSKKNNNKITYNTLVKNISNYIGYHYYSNNQMSIIYNVDITKLTTYFPIHYNNYNIKNILYNVIDSKVNMKLFFGKEWEYVIKIVRESISNYSYERFLLNNDNLPNIQYFINNRDLFNLRL